MNSQLQTYLRNQRLNLWFFRHKLGVFITLGRAVRRFFTCGGYKINKKYRV